MFGADVIRNGAERRSGVANDVRRTLREMRRIAGTRDRRAKIEGMERFGIRPQRAIGLNTPQLRAMARGLKPNQALAEALWETGIHDARILAALIADPVAITRTVMDRWAGNFASWDICDACCCNVFNRSRMHGSKSQNGRSGAVNSNAGQRLPR